MAKTPVVAITGGTICGNRGAESMLTTTIGMIRQDFPDAKFNVFSYYPQKDRALCRDAEITILSGKPVALVTRHFLGALVGALIKALGGNVPNSNFFKIARTLDESDVLLDIGGITFSDGRAKYLPFNILTIWPAMLMGVPVVKLAQAVGPFHEFLNRLSASLFMKKCRHIFARGEKTAEFLQELGYPADQTDLVADVAFLYKPEFSLSLENEERVAALLKKLKDTRKPVIVFSPSILVDTQSKKKGLDYAAKFYELIERLGADKYQFVFIPNASREGSDKKHNNDLLALVEMRARAESGALPAAALQAVEWVDYDINTASIRAIIDTADVLVTSRYHAMISGLCLAVPTVVIGWGHKYKETMAYFDLGDYSLDFGASEMDLPAIVQDALDHKTEIHKQIAKNLPDVRAKSGIQFTFLKKELS
ncbi:MAG: colanic acid/amylovoran biosynthesis protein [Chloroflexota bacterium]|nr:colanic acid/amylovoran biosynthesis protein [Chloroflexota bacterium]